MSLVVEYALGEHGWARLQIGYGEHHAETDVSYITDPLPKLAHVALEGLNRPGSPRNAIVDFEDEPGGIRMMFEPRLAEPSHERPRPEEEVILVGVLRLADSDRPQKGEPLFEFETTSAELARIILSLLEKLYDSCGIVEYQRRWMEGDFPVTAMLRLRAVLGLPPVERRLW